MHDNKKSKNDLQRELNELKQENAKLKARFDKEIKAAKNPERAPGGDRTNTDHVEADESAATAQILKGLFDDYLKMYASRDDNLTTHFSENFSGFTGGGDFLVKDKEEWVAITRQDFAQVKDPLRIELKDLCIQSLSDTIAVTTGFFTIHLPIKDHVLSRETARLVLIFRKESGGWKITHSSISIPYYLVREGEVYPMKELVERNQLLEDLIAEKTSRLSEANENLKRTNNDLASEVARHKRTEEELLESNRRLEAIISATPDGIGMISLDGKIELIMSEKLPNMYGYSLEQREEFVGKSVFEFIDPSNHQLLTENIRKLLSGGTADKLSEYTAIKKDKSRFYVDVNSTILYDSEGKPSSILFVERDITERKRTESIIREQYNQLNELNATKDKLFSIIAHDLRSPFQSLLSSSELLATEIENLSHGEIKSASRGLNNSLKNLYSLLENLLNWSLMQRDMLEYNPSGIDLFEFTGNLIELSGHAAVKKNISITNNVKKGTRVYADADMVRSIIQNLITNAVKFTPENGQIIISSAGDKGFVEVSVRDNGIGIGADRAAKMFSFETLSTTDGTAGEKGTGLGLSLCKEFVERNGGKIWAESEQGKGSVFTFTLRKEKE